jgi:CheY-like chemotaxis protein
VNELYQTCATRAESRKPTTQEILIASVQRPGAPRPPVSDLTEELGDQEYSATRVGPTITKRHTVFYVDDNRRALRVLTSVLEGCGFKMVIACNTEEALEQMEQNAFGLVLLTYRLPRMISFKLAREIKRLSPGTPIILVSGHTLVAPEELTYVDAYVGKGATLDSLLTQMRLLIGRT